MRPYSRRDFLQSTLVGAAGFGLGVSGARAEEDAKVAKKAGALDPLRVAVIGVNGRGMSHVGGLTPTLGCRITHVCDADSGVIGKAMTAVEKQTGKAPTYVQDFRKILDNKEIDVVSIATPNHWHALMAIWAIQAGKDVYVEKPVSHNVSEGRRIVEAARKYNRICQTGTQCRSMPGMREAIAFVQGGGIGKVTVARGLCYKRRPSIGQVKGEGKIPSGCDYDLWCGPAAKIALKRTKLHYDWHWVWNTGNGDLGNQGIHQMDIARWGLQKTELPTAAISVGGRFGYSDDGETANTQVNVFDYGDSTLIFEVRGLPTKEYRGAGVGVVFHGTEGSVVIPSYDSGIVFDKDDREVKRFKGGNDGLHYANFVAAVRSRKAETLNADILDGHLSSALCHLGNISYRLGEERTFNQEPIGFTEHRDVAETVHRTRDHLKENNAIVEGGTYRLGKKLTVDPKAENFVGDAQANAFLAREPRKPFVVPDKV